MTYALLRFAHLVGLTLIGAGLIGVWLLFSGTWMTVQFWGGWRFVEHPWLVGMIALFIFEFVEGNTVTRLYFMRLRRLTHDALVRGTVTPELAQARRQHVPTFTHFLDIPILLVIVSLGALRPSTWSQFFIGTVAALAVATALTISIPRLYPWDIAASQRHY